MMKHRLCAALLVGVLCLSSAGTVCLALNHYFSLKQLEQLRQQYAQMTNTRNAMQALASDAVEYSKRNPAMESLLQEFDAKFKAAAATNAPAPKPSR